LWDEDRHPLKKKKKKSIEGTRGTLLHLLQPHHLQVEGGTGAM